MGPPARSSIARIHPSSVPALCHDNRYQPVPSGRLVLRWRQNSVSRATQSASAPTSPVLTAAAAMAGEMGVAAASLQELRHVQPNISLAWISDNMPVTPDERGHYSEAFPCARDRYLGAFRRAE